MERGTELYNLTGAINDIHDTLGVFIVRTFFSRSLLLLLIFAHYSIYHRSPHPPLPTPHQPMNPNPDLKIPPWNPPLL